MTRTKIVRVDPFNPSDELLAPCAQALREGGLVAFPTETVYGLGSNALDESAVAKIFQAKGRPQDNPLIVHVSRIESVPPLVLSVSPVALNLMYLFWPGPLTLLFPRSPQIPARVTAGLPTVGIRMPDHPVAQRLIDLAGVPVAAPSANASGRPSPTSFEEVLADLDGKVDYIIDGGYTDIGVESTVLDISGPVPKILRPGGLYAEDLQEVLGRVEVIDYSGSGPTPSPGMKYRHYAPKADVYLATGTPEDQARAIVRFAQKRMLSGNAVAVLASGENLGRYERLASEYPDLFHVIYLGSRDDLAPVASRLFSGLRHADHLGASVVFAESFPRVGLGLAIQNRLERASAGKHLPEHPEGAPFRILMVCSGNTCRSPMAEEILKDVWSARSAGVPLEVISRGTATVWGLPATPEAVIAADQLGVDLRGHRSAPISQGDMEWADLVVTMTESHKKNLLFRFPGYDGKIYTLSEVSSGAVSGDVDDPFGKSQEVYNKTAESLKRGLTALADRMARMVKVGEDAWLSGGPDQAQETQEEHE
ncbi:MAG: L-threonylcarbamoyladenylate synthase [Bacillota bacterium]